MNMNNKLNDKDIGKVNGGLGTKVTGDKKPKELGNGSVGCPDCPGTVLDYVKHVSTGKGRWLFVCPNCGVQFVKDTKNNWYRFEKGQKVTY